MNMLNVLSVILTSLMIASFFGHAIHWLIHQRWTGIFYRAHLEHHLELYPPGDLLSDAYRTAKWYNSGTFLFTPPLVIILAGLGGLMLKFGAPIWAIATFGIVLVGFGLLNDWVHDSTHIKNHWANRFAWFRKARDLHFRHHWNMKRNFGIVFFAWDRVFKTFIETK